MTRTGVLASVCVLGAARLGWTVAGEMPAAEATNQAVRGAKVLVCFDPGEGERDIEAAAQAAGAKVVRTFPAAMAQMVLLDVADLKPAEVTRALHNQRGALAFLDGRCTEAVPWTDRKGMRREPQPWFLILWPPGSLQQMQLVLIELDGLFKEPRLKVERVPLMDGQEGVGVRCKLGPAADGTLLDAFLAFHAKRRLGLVSFEYRDVGLSPR